MNKYETVMIINSKITQGEFDKVINKITNVIENNGKIDRKEDYGIKKLAYEIRKNKEGHYYLIEFESEAYFIRELERVYRITDEVLKFIVVRKDVEE